MAKKEKAKGRYDDYAFAKGWPSVSAIKGLRDKPWLNGWYASKGLEAFSIVKESQIVGNLVDNYIERFFGDPDVKDMSDVLKKYILTTDNRTMRGEYYQSIKNFHSFVK